MLAAVLMIATAPRVVIAGDRCKTKRCTERVAMRQCSNARPIPCIRRAAIHWRVDFRLQLAIARCESGLRPTVTNSGGSGSSGLMQFMPSTFATTPYRHRSIFSAKFNALAGAWLLSRAGTGPWSASRHCWG